MSLTDFMRDLVADPKRLAQYKQNPERFLAREGKDLPQADQEMLGQMFMPVTLEVSTVMSVRMPPPSLDIALLSDIPEGAVCLDGLYVTFTSPNTIFLAEKGVVQCRLLPHSYLHIDPDDSNLRMFSLNPCYGSANDPDDVP